MNIIIVDSFTVFIQNIYMNKNNLSRSGFRFFFQILIISYSLLMAHTVQAVSLNEIHKSLPKRIDGWIAEPQGHIYDEKTIFQYINGSAEVYKAYNMKQCLSRKYTIDGGPNIVLDIFDMHTSKDAFGVFTHDTDGETVQIGQEALYRPGWLSFWKHRFFISIYMEEETETAKKAVLGLGKKIASLIKLEGAKPYIISLLPQEGLQTNNIHYLHHPVILNYHFYLADENILNLTNQTDAVLASYQRGSESARLLLVIYPDIHTAAKSLKRFLHGYLQNAGDNGISLLENKKWAAVVLKGSLLAVVLQSDSRQFAESLLRAIQ